MRFLHVAEDCDFVKVNICDVDRGHQRWLGVLCWVSGFSCDRFGLEMAVGYVLRPSK